MLHPRYRADDNLSYSHTVDAFQSISTDGMNATDETNSTTTVPTTSTGKLQTSDNVRLSRHLIVDGKSLGFILGLALGLGVPTGVAAVGSFLYFWKIYRSRHGRVNIMHN